MVADVFGAGGERAVQAEAASLTPRVVIANRVAEVIRRELSERLVPAGEPGLVSRNPFRPGDLAQVC